MHPLIQYLWALEGLYTEHNGRFRTLGIKFGTHTHGPKVKTFELELEKAFPWRVAGCPQPKGPSPISPTEASMKSFKIIILYVHIKVYMLCTQCSLRNSGFLRTASPNIKVSLCSL